ncbi:MAG: hypothetical protein JXA21_19420 [Anaerolineae bacterium]|nr:hypothetical protein [Anaerolineae bacterium]
MELINRYVYQVGRRLPQRMRADVEKELHSLLLDTLEERAGHSAETQFTEEEQVAVLTEFGPPEKMADKYRPQPRYVIGPKLYNLYLLVVSVVAGAGLLASIIAAVVPTLASKEPISVTGILLRTATIFMNIALNGIGSTTLVFAVLDRLIPDEEFEAEEDKPWNPRELPEAEPRDEIKPVNLIVEIVFLALISAAFLAFGKNIGGAFYDGVWHATPPFLSPDFFALYLPLFVARWGITILLNLALLRQGRWQPVTRIADLLIHGFDIYILVRMLNGPTPINAEFFSSVLANVPEAAENLQRMLDDGLKMGLLVALIVTVIEIATRAYRLIRDRSLGTPTTPGV